MIGMKNSMAEKTNIDEGYEKLYFRTCDPHAAHSHFFRRPEASEAGYFFYRPGNLPFCYRNSLPGAFQLSGSESRVGQLPAGLFNSRWTCSLL
jgi:hypothetical protein